MDASVWAIVELGPALLLGLLFGLVAGLIPGISGRIGLLIALPVALWFDPTAAAVFLISMHAVVHTTGSIPAVLLGLPTSSSEAATVVDGWPMMQKGRGGEAVGAILAASAMGGILGAAALLLLVPLGGLMAQQFTSAEVAALSATGLLAIAALSGRSFALGLAVASLGILAATVGVDNHTGIQRFTFNRLELWDGLNIAAIVAGLFVIPEMLRAGRVISAPDCRNARPASPLRIQFSDVFVGCIQMFRHRWLALRSAVLGIIIGFIPGLGASVVVWLAYSHASTSSSPTVPFGQGAIEGIIAPEAANNSKEGGAMLPTMLFAVPGTSSMAILLGAFALLGIELGPGMAARDPWIIEMAGWVILIANLMAFPICLALAPLLTHLAGVHRLLVVPFALMAATVAALAISGSVETLLQMVVFGLLGVLLTRLNWPRAPFVLGFVIGPIFEGALTRTIMTVGTGAFLRPMVILIMGIAVCAVVFSVLRRPRRTPVVQTDGADGAAPASNISVFLLLGGACGLALVTALSQHGQAAIMPILAASCGLATLLSAMFMKFPKRTLDLTKAPLILALFLSYLVATWLIGSPIASGVFAVVAYAFIIREWRFGLLFVGIGFAFFAWLLAGESMGIMQPLTSFWETFAQSSVQTKL